MTLTSVETFPDFRPPPPAPGGDLAKAALIAQLVAFCTGVDAHEIAGRARASARAARARQIAMYLAHTAVGWPLARVGQAFGRDRSTASHACALVEDRRDDARFDAALEAMETCLRAAPARMEGWL